MKTGRIHTQGGIQYGTDTEVQSSALVGAEAPYMNPIVPTVTNVGGALDALLEGSAGRYVEIQDTPYLIVRAGDYVCMPGSNLPAGSANDLPLLIYLGNGVLPGERVSIMGMVGLWQVRSSSPMRVGDKVGGFISSLDEGCTITLLMTSQGWIATHLLGNIDILPG